MPKTDLRPVTHLVFCLAAFFLASAGCTRYDYELVSPPEAAQPIGRTVAARVELEPLTYDLLTREDRLVMVVRNDTDAPVKLVGEDSYVVDPEGESHAVPTRTVGPRATTKLIFPPMSAEPRRGPAFGFGFGVGVGLSGAGPPEGGHFAPAAPDEFGHPAAEPRYYSVEPDESVRWDWRGAGTIRMRLVYEHNGGRATHDFAFARRKA